MKHKPGCDDWIRAVGHYEVRGLAEGILALFEKGAITRRKAVEMLKEMKEARYLALRDAPWKELEW
jgi:hypothetical protein